MDVIVLEPRYHVDSGCTITPTILSLAEMLAADPPYADEVTSMGFGPIRAAACLATAVCAALAATSDPGAMLAVLPLFAAAWSPEAEIAELARIDMHVRKPWSKSLITVDGTWRRRYAAATYDGYCTASRNVKAAIADARGFGSDFPDLVSLAAYETQVTDGPTGLYFRNHVPIIDSEDADISRNLVYVVARPGETADALAARLGAEVEGSGQVSEKVRAVARPGIVDMARQLLAAFIRR